MKVDVQIELRKAIRARDAAADLLAHAKTTDSQLLIAYEWQLQSMQNEVARLEREAGMHQQRQINEAQQVSGKKGGLYRVA